MKDFKIGDSIYTFHNQKSIYAKITDVFKRSDGIKVYVLNYKETSVRYLKMSEDYLFNTKEEALNAMSELYNNISYTS